MNPWTEKQLSLSSSQLTCCRVDSSQSLGASLGVILPTAVSHQLPFPAVTSPPAGIKLLQLLQYSTVNITPLLLLSLLFCNKCINSPSARGCKKSYI